MSNQEIRNPLALNEDALGENPETTEEAIVRITNREIKDSFPVGGGSITGAGSQGTSNPLPAIPTED